MTVCLSKGLGAPIGSLVLGDKAFISRVRRWRKVLGGGMRQAGILAAAAKIALTEHVDRLADDHANAKALAEGLNRVPGFKVNTDVVQTNIVFTKVDPAIDQQALAAKLKEKDIIITPGNPMRLVTHIDITRDDIDTFLKELEIALA